MRPESLLLVVRSMVPAKDRLSAEADLVHQMRLHHLCEKNECCECGILVAAGAFFSTMSVWALRNVSTDIYHLLLDEWVAISVAYDRGEKIGDLVFRMYSTACTYRLLAT